MKDGAANCNIPDIRCIARETLAAFRVTAILLDIDGTILGSAGKLAAGVKDEIARVRKKGIHVSLASGRPYFAAGTIINELKITSPCLFENGALIIEPQSAKELLKFSIETATLSTFCAELKKSGFYLELYDGKFFYSETNPQFSLVHKQYLQFVPQLIPDALNFIGLHEILKVACIFPKEREKEFTTLSERFPSLYAIINPLHMHPDLSVGVITSINAQRTRIFEPFLQLLGSKAQNVMCLGDGNSDVPFLKLCGVGIAMGNAQNSVKQHARFVTSSVDQGGVALALQLFIP